MLDNVNISGRDIKGQVTPDCVVLTVIDIPADGSSPARLDVKEHDSFTAAVKYLLDQGEIVTGDWDRIYIINPERLRYREDATKRGKS